MIGLPTNNTLEERVRKLLQTVSRTNRGAPPFVEIKREADLKSELGNDPSQHFFYLEIPGLRTANGRQKIKFYTKLFEGSSFDIQFGRVLACHMLNEREKLNWKNCVLDKSVEA